MALTASDFFERADQLPFAALPALTGGGGVLVVAPHPDDESLGCGGLLTLCVRAGVHVHVAIVSDGTGSHRNSKAYPHDRLRDLRESETKDACAALGVPQDAVTFLRLPDQSVPTSGPAADAAITRLAEIAASIRASAIFVTWRGDPHCDHEASFVLARATSRRLSGVRLVEYPVWGHTLAPETALQATPKGCRLDISAVLDRKRAAIKAHRSQITRMIADDPHGFALPPAMLARFERPFEVFLEGS